MIWRNEEAAYLSLVYNIKLATSTNWRNLAPWQGLKTSLKAIHLLCLSRLYKTITGILYLDCSFVEKDKQCIIILNEEKIWNQNKIKEINLNYLPKSMPDWRVNWYYFPFFDVPALWNLMAQILRSPKGNWLQQLNVHEGWICLCHWLQNANSAVEDTKLVFLNHQPK